MKGENLRNEWTHKERAGRHPVGEIRVRDTQGADGGVDKEERKSLSDLRNNQERGLPWQPR